MVVIVIGCALFVTSYCDVKFTFQIQQCRQSFLTQCISLYAHFPYSLLYNLICHCSVFLSFCCSGTFRAVIQVSMLLSVISQMGRNVAYMFYHEIIKIRGFVQGSVIDINDKISRALCKKLNTCYIRNKSWAHPGP